MINLLKTKLSIVMIMVMVSSIASGQDLKDLKVLSVAIPYEVELMFDHLRNSPLSSEEKEGLSANLELLNSDLGGLDKRSLMFLFKSETYKGILTNQYLKQDSKIQVSNATLDSLRSKLEKKSVVYTQFSTWIVESLINDLLPFTTDNFLNRFQNIKRSNPKEVVKARKLKKILKYISPILFAFLSKSPEDFNTLSKNIILDNFSRIALKSYYFKQFYLQNYETKEPLFAIPKMNNTLPMEKKMESSSLNTESSNNKSQAIEDVQNLDETDMSSVSEKIDDLNVKTSN